MCKLLYTTERKRLSEEAIQRIQVNSILTLRQYNFDEKNAEMFVDQFQRTVAG